MKHKINNIYMNKSERHDVINFLIKEHNFNNPKYLEIGVQRGLTFSNIKSNDKYGVDPSPIQEGIELTNFKMSSDDFFNNLEEHIKYDLIFIDGLHECHQVAKDFLNSLKHSSIGSLIIFDDVYPNNKNEQLIPVSTIHGPCTGDVWKYIYHILPDIILMNTDIYFFENLHSQVRGMFAIKINKNILNSIDFFNIDGNIISKKYDYEKDFEDYSKKLR